MILPRFQHCPILISRKWFDANAKWLLYAHWIKFIWYDDSGIFFIVTNKLDEFLGTINYSKFDQTTMKNFASLEALNSIESKYKKSDYDAKSIDLVSYIESINSSIAILGYQHTVNVIIYPEYKKLRPRYKTNFKIRYGWDWLFFLTRGTTKTMRSKIWEFYFPISKPEFERLKKKEGVVKYTFANLSIVTNNWIENISLSDDFLEILIQDIEKSFEKTENIISLEDS